MCLVVAAGLSSLLAGVGIVVGILVCSFLYIGSWVSFVEYADAEE